jgi:hypothetical protein
MEASHLRPNTSPGELRRDYRASDPAGRLRQGFLLSRFGSRLQQATKEATARDQDRLDLAALREARDENG